MLFDYDVLMTAQTHCQTLPVLLWSLKVLAWQCWWLSLMPSARKRLWCCELKNCPRSVVGHTPNLGRKYRGNILLFILLSCVHLNTQEVFHYKPNTLVFPWQDAAAAIDNMVRLRILTVTEGAFCWYRGLVQIGLLSLWSVRVRWCGKGCHQVNIHCELIVGRISSCPDASPFTRVLPAYPSWLSLTTPHDGKWQKQCQLIAHWNCKYVQKGRVSWNVRPVNNRKEKFRKS